MRLSLTILALCAFVLVGRVSEAESVIAAEPRGEPRPLPFTFDLRAAPMIGLDRPLRGGAFALGFALKTKSIQPGLELRITYDASLEPFIAGADLVVRMGDELRFLIGAELPISELVLVAGNSRLALRPCTPPNRFAMAATLAEFGPIRRSEPDSGPRAFLEAELAWSAYEIVEEDAAPIAPNATESDPRDAAEVYAVMGVSGFAVGFRAFVGFRLLFY